MDLCTAANVKTLLEVTSDANDDILALVIPAVSRKIEDFLNRNLEKTARTKYFDAGKRLYYLSAYPVDTTAALSVTYAGIVQTLDSDYYLWEDEGLIEFYAPTVRTEPKQVLITWTGGYADIDALPSDIVFAAMLQSAFVYQNRKKVGISSISYPDGSVSKKMSLDLLDEVKEMLRNYRRVPG